MDASSKMLVSSMPSRKGYISEDVHRQAKKIDSPVVNDILVAARKGDTYRVLQALGKREGGAEASAVVDKHGRNCLQLACLKGHFETVMAILHTNQMNINSANKRGLTALHDACTEGHTKIALLLLSLGAYIMARTTDGWTCLMCACSNGHLQLARILLASGCEPIASTTIGLTALHIAAWKGYSTLVVMLIKDGCCVSSETNNGKTALQLSQEEEQSKCVAILNAATSEQSKDPVYRIAALEGEVQSCHTKLSETCSDYEQMLKTYREEIEVTKREKEKDLAMAAQKFSQLDSKLKQLQALLPLKVMPPQVKIDVVQTPPMSVKSSKKSKSIREIRLNPKVELRPRSASYSDLTSVGKADTCDHTQAEKVTKISPETQQLLATPTSQRRGSTEKRSITELVADSLKNPASISSIRQELKSDDLTPKIQRKFLIKNSNPSTLPSLTPPTSPSTLPSSSRPANDFTSPCNGSVLETSPLLKEISFGTGSPGNSPGLSRRRMNMLMKDSVI